MAEIDTSGKRLDQGVSLALGPRTTELLQRRPELLDTMMSFSLSGDLSREKVTILFPYILVPSEMIYENQMEALESVGDTILIHLSQQNFSQEMVNAQLGDLLTSSVLEGKDITFLGISFSAQSLTQFLLQADEDVLGHISRLVMMGGLQTVEDLASDRVRRTAHLIQKMGFENVLGRFAGVAKFMMGKDPKLVNNGKDDPTIRSQTLKTYRDSISNKAIYEQLRNLLSIDFVQRKHIDIPTLVVWWETEITSPEGQARFEDLFSNRRVERLPLYHHGWVGSSAEELNPLLLEFLATPSAEDASGE